MGSVRLLLPFHHSPSIFVGMSRAPALPFFLRRSDDVIGEAGITSTAETIHGLLRLEQDRLVLQWRLARQVDRVGAEIRCDHEVEPVREISLPVSGLAGATVRSSWWLWARGSRLVLTAADLRTFEALVGLGRFRLDHPAEVVLRIRPRDLGAARNFAADLELALAERALRQAERAEDPSALAGPGPGPPALLRKGPDSGAA